MKKLAYICLILVCFQFNVSAQKETSWWHFGLKAGLNFNNIGPATASDGTVITNMPEAIVGYVNTYEGCFTLSTYDGNLLMASDGIVVYDKNGTQMPNGFGLKGDPSASQSGLVIPRPGSSDEYYIVTVPAADVAPTNGVNYSVVDMRLNGGLGDIVASTKNTSIKNAWVYENIAVIPNANEDDYWLLHRTAQTFEVFPVTAAGISSTPHQTISHASIIGNTRFHALGELIVSPDESKIASFNYHGGQVITAKFDKATGLISNIQVISIPMNTYGGTFSGNNEYLYVTGGNVGSSVYVGKWNDIRAGITLTNIAGSAGVGNIKRAMDGKLYGVHGYATTVAYTSKTLSVIEDPDNGDTSVKIFPNYLINPAYIGLPTFASGFIRVKAKEQPFSCATHTRTYGVEIDIAGGNTPATLEWDFGDGSPKVTQNVVLPQTKYALKYAYHTPGSYTITVTPYKADGTKIKAISMPVNNVICTLKSNRMTRSELQNANQQ